MTSETEKELLLRVADGLDRDATGLDPESDFTLTPTFGLMVSEMITISRVLREAAEGPKTRPMDLPVMLQHALNAGAAGVEWVDYDPTRLAVYQRLASALGVPLPPPPATETTKTEEGDR